MGHCSDDADCLSLARSHKVRDRTELGVEEAAVGAEGEAVGHVGDPVADEAGAAVGIGGGGDLGFEGFGHQAEAFGLGGLDVAIAQHAEELLEDVVSLVIELLELRAAEDELEGDFFMQIGA